MLGNWRRIHGLNDVTVRWLSRLWKSKPVPQGFAGWTNFEPALSLAQSWFAWVERGCQCGLVAQIHTGCICALPLGLLIFDTMLFKTYFGSFMVKQGFKNNPVIGMSAAAGSSAKLLHQARDRVERDVDLLESNHIWLWENILQMTVVNEPHHQSQESESASSEVSFCFSVQLLRLMCPYFCHQTSDMCLGYCGMSRNSLKR